MLTGLLLAVMSSTTPATGPSGARATQSRVRQPTREMAAASIELGDSLAREMKPGGQLAGLLPQGVHVANTSCTGALALASTFWLATCGLQFDAANHGFVRLNALAAAGMAQTQAMREQQMMLLVNSNQSLWLQLEQAQRAREHATGSAMAAQQLAVQQQARYAELEERWRLVNGTLQAEQQARLQAEQERNTNAAACSQLLDRIAELELDKQRQEREAELTRTVNTSLAAACTAVGSSVAAISTAHKAAGVGVGSLSMSRRLAQQKERKADQRKVRGGRRLLTAPPPPPPPPPPPLPPSAAAAAVLPSLPRCAPRGRALVHSTPGPALARAHLSARAMCADQVARGAAHLATVRTGDRAGQYTMAAVLPCCQSRAAASGGARCELAVPSRGLR